ncbi:MAG: Coenzyme F420 hydrogenase/dehydrogenase, beta subunit C-terminal domain [Clostridia bacterium]|nr:Coenzyme F420 hydrogenase/dehydrogenase, beta subunit C-terminal domain [Clostridia bacterium]
MPETIASLDPLQCYGCRACEGICPAHCIRMEKNAEGFFYPHLDESACVQCGKCAAACPGLHPADYPYAPRAYAAVNTDEETRSTSSSGGVFFPVARQILRRNGVVFGVEFDENFLAQHAFAETEEDARAFCRSKYMQSDTRDSFIKAKEFLDAGRPVLFTGTACQIAGLKQYLGHEYDNLYTIDLICGGVASPALWQKYLQSFRKGKPQDVSFRDKSDGWYHFALKISFSDGTDYRCEFRKNPYMEMFLHGFSIRECCYRCGFRQQHIAADLTIADFWGIDEVLPQLNDDRGISVVLSDTEKGEALLQNAPELSLTPVDLEKALQRNRMSRERRKRFPRRDKYLKALPHRGFKYLYNKCYNSTHTEVLKSKVAKLIGYKS